MTGVIRSQLTGLARTIADLRERVRVAVAGELGRVVSGAVQQVVQAVVSGPDDPPRSEPPACHHPRADRWDDEDDRWGRPRDPWADDPDDVDGYPRDRDRIEPRPSAGPREPRPGDPPGGDPGVAAAVAAGVYAARLWVARQGTRLAAAAVGLGVGLLGILGGPVARTAVAVLAAVGDILGAADALGGGAARLDHL